MNQVDWTTPTVSRHCPLCSSSEAVILSTSMQYHLDLTTVICTNCSFVYTNPLPSEELYNRFYAEAYASFYGSIAVNPPQSGLTNEPIYIREILNLIEQYIKLDKSKLLEVGPGKGNFLYWAKARGADVQGIEPSEAFYHCLKSNGINAISDTLENIHNYGLGKFDCVTMLHVLEHFYDPNRALRICREMIDDHGILVIIVPNILLPYRSLDRYFLRYVHPSNFSPQTLQVMLSKHGFTVVYSQERGSERWHQPHNLLVIARKQAQIPNTFELPPAKLALEVRNRLNWYRVYWRWIKGPCWHLHRIYILSKKNVYRGLRFCKRAIKKVQKNA